jgi:hypothetical protein
VLPYLGPEIVAVIQAAPSFAPSDSRTGARLPFRKNDHTVIPPVVFSSSLSKTLRTPTVPESNSFRCCVSSRFGS